MYITIINDCASPNDLGRQSTRFSSLFASDNPALTFVGVTPSLGNKDATIEAAGELIDILDASEGSKGVISVNVAPRGDKKEWKNGTPFCYFFYKDSLVVSTFEGYTLSLLKKLNITDSVYLTDLDEVVKKLGPTYFKDNEKVERILSTQFRSFDYSPFLAKWVWDDYDVPSEKVDIQGVAEIPKVIWYIDGFGNCKTTLLKEDLKINNGKVSTIFGELNFYDRLKDLPMGEAGIFVGSSGIGNDRFIEIGIQRGNASKEFNAFVGCEVLKK